MLCLTSPSCASSRAARHILCQQEMSDGFEEGFFRESPLSASKANRDSQEMRKDRGLLRETVVDSLWNQSCECLNAQSRQSCQQLYI